LKKPIPFGKYYLLERINVGGMAEVFKAKTFGVEGFERLLAVKRILPNIAEDEEFIAMFIDEAKIAVQLQHANVAQIFDLGKVDDSFFIALEYVHGKDLRSIFDRMRGKGDALPIQQACYVIMQVCEGLDYAHNKRDAQGRELHLVHRDISPQNVLIGYEGEVKLIDFGIAKAAGKASKTQAGILKGKFGYMSPEQVRGLPIDRRSDIFSVGIVLYELLTNERLFVGESDFSTLEKVRNVEIMPPSSYNKRIPDELERIVLKALAKDPEDRYQNAIDLHDDLQAFLYTVGEFYSRKDLAAWMKKIFAIEIEEDTAKLEQYRQLAPPGAAVEPSARRAVASAGGAGGGAGFGGMPPSPLPAPIGPRPTLAKGGGASGGGLNWDDEELDTQIFDKEPPEPPPVAAADELFFEDDDRTVANEPPPDILAQARPPESLVTPRPRALPTPPSGGPARRPTPSTSVSVPRATLIGVPPSTLLPASARGTGTSQVGAGPPPGLAGVRKSGLNLPTPNLSAVSPPPGPSLTPPRLQPVFTFDAPPPQPQQTYASGAFGQPSPPRPAKVEARGGRYTVLATLGVLVIGVVAWYYYWTTNRPGKLQLATLPSDAIVLIDNGKVGDHSPVVIEKSPGYYTLSVMRDGYVRSDQNIEIHAGQPLALTVSLEPSPDTGFELTSDPPGGLVWLDGAPISGPNGQARTDFRAYRIPPGHHVLEIKGEARFKSWRQDIEVEPGAIRKVHATLVPSSERGPAMGNPTPIANRERRGGDSGEPSAATRTRESRETAKDSTRDSSSSGSTTAVSSSSSSGSRSSGSSGGKKKKGRDALADGSDTGDDSGLRAADSGGGECSITIGSRPWSEVWIDGKNTSKHTPFADYKIACGRHKIGFKRADLQIDRTETITVRPGEKFKQSYTLANDSE
jgi:eukaryotic-like serine/threonine-protein kinase